MLLMVVMMISTDWKDVRFDQCEWNRVGGKKKYRTMPFYLIVGVLSSSLFLSTWLLPPLLSGDAITLRDNATAVVSISCCAAVVSHAPHQLH